MPKHPSKPAQGREFEHGSASHAERAAQLLQRARAGQAGSRTPTDSVASTSTSASDDLSSHAIPLPLLLKSLCNPALGHAAFRVKEAIPLAGKLVRAKLNTQIRLSHLNGPVLEEAGVTSEVERHKILVAFGVREVGGSAVGGARGGAMARSKRAWEDGQTRVRDTDGKKSAF